MRIGSSFDFHPFKKGRKLILGGVHIPYEMGLDGVSDADVLYHAIAEAVLGALALGDLGTHFKPKDSKDMDSSLIMLKVKNMMEELNYKIVNIDSTIMLEEPKLAPYIEKMRQNISNIFNININQVSVKATTAEKTGPIGHKEGCLAQATVLLEEVDYGRNTKRLV